MATSSPRFGDDFEDALDETMDAVRRAIEDGARDPMDGGVPECKLVDYTDASEGAVEHRVRVLQERGRLVTAHGYNPETNRPRQGVLPADHPDAGSREVGPR